MRTPDMISADLRFGDLDDLCETAQGWDVDFHQLDRGPFQGRLQSVATETFLLTSACFNRAVDQHGSPPPGMFSFAIPGRPGLQTIWRGARVPENAFMVFRPRDEVDAVSPADWGMHVVSIPPRFLRGLCQSLGLPDITESLDRNTVFGCRHRDVRRLREQLETVLGACGNPTRTVGDSITFDVLIGDIARELIGILSPPLPAGRPEGSRVRRMALREIRDYLEAFPEEVTTVRDLCEIGGVSIRTLELAFQERYGVTPKVYLQSLRLNGVRRGLREADPETTKVADAANRWGFWHMGQFAADYRRHFGEYPSQTLKAKPGRSASRRQAATEPNLMVLA